MQINRLYKLVFFFLVLFPAVTFPQSYLVHTYTESDGLGNSTVYDIAQDTTGRVWFATRSGVSVYDGFNWHTYSVEEGLPTIAHIKIKVDEKGTIWALSELSRFKISHFDGKRWINSIKFTPKVNFHFLSSFEVAYKNNQLLMAIGTNDDGVYIYYQYKWIHISEANGLLSSSVSNIVYWNGKLIVSTDKGLSVIDDLKVDNSINNFLSLPSHKIAAMTIEDKNKKNFAELKIWLLGDTWIGYLQHDKFVIVSENIKTYFDNKYFFEMVLCDQHGGLYYGNQSHITHFNSVTKSVMPLGRKNGLISEGVTSFLLDRESNLWIASLRGVSKIPHMQFANYGKAQGLLEDEVTVVREFKSGEFIFGHNIGLTFYNGRDFRYFDFPNDSLLFETNIRVLDIDIDSQKNLWIAVSHKGLLKIEPSGKRQWFGKEVGFKGGVASVLVDKDDRVLISVNNKLYMHLNGKISPLPMPRLKNSTFRKLFKGPHGTIFIATNNMGLYQFDGRNWKIFSSKIEADANNVFSVLVDHKNQILVGALGGLFVCQNGSLVRFKLKNKEIIKRPVYLIVEDRENQLWLGSDNGVFKWDGTSLKHYTISDGFAGREVNRSAGIVDSKGRVWIGTDRGVSCYQQEFDIQPENILPAKVQILSVKTASKNLNFAQANNLTYQENNLIFEFSAISFLNEKQIYFQYKLEGYDKDWSDECKLIEPHVRYTNLPAGRYYFQIRAKNELGKWSETVSTSLISIEKPFWAQWWFYFLAILIFGLILYSLFRNISQQRYSFKLEKQVLQRTAQLKESEKQYRTTIDSMADLIHVIDKNFQVMLYNTICHIWIKRLGFSNDVIGTPLFDIFNFLTDRVRNEYLCVFESGKMLKTVDTNLIDGELIITETRKIPIFENSEVVRVLTVIRDITEQRIAEEELAKTQALLSAAIEQTAAGIIIADAPDAIIRLANTAALNLLGKSKKLKVKFSYQIHPDNWQMYNSDGTKLKTEELPHFQAVKYGQYVKNETIIFRQKNQDDRYVLCNAAPVKNEKNEIIAGVVVFSDITSLKKAEEKIKASLAEKEVLLKEIHHRVKNNLQVISSLLYLQSKHIKDEKALQMFVDSQDRVRSMALVHEKLYQSKNLAHINFFEYIKDLVNQLNRSFSNNQNKIKFNLNVNGIQLDIDAAIPCGLIINELVSNAFKYAFPTDKKGEITVELNLIDSQYYRLLVSDNGIGLPLNFDLKNCKSLGLKLVKTVVDQLDGKIQIFSNSGASFEIIFLKKKS